MDIKILDCTLRDGGYYTDWYFSTKFVEHYLKAIKSLPIQIIEVGYLSDNKDSLGPFYHLDNKALNFIKDSIRKDQKVYAMINFKEIKNTKHLNSILKKKIDYIDGVRFAISPKQIESLNRIVKNIPFFKNKLSLNINLMYLSQWINDKILIKKIFSKIPKNTNTLAFVDSHGSVTPDQVNTFFNETNQYKKKIKYGCHFHNNCGLALANSLAAQKQKCEVIDMTFSGMGRGAGNAETELFIAVDKDARKRVKGYDLNYFLENIHNLKKKLNWGSSFAYAFASKNGYSQAEMMNILQKKRLDPSSALKQIFESKTKKTIFENFTNFKNYLKKKNYPPILIGGGKNQIDFGNFLYNKINPKSMIVFSSIRTMKNFYALNLSIPNKKLLIISGNEIKKFNKTKIEKIIKTLNINFFLVERKFFSKNNKVITSKKTILSSTYAENPLLLIGSLLNKVGFKKLNLAFFDGNLDNEKDKIIMHETSNCLKKLIAMKFRINSLTKTFLKIKEVNPWIYD